MKSWRQNPRFAERTRSMRALMRTLAKFYAENLDGGNSALVIGV